MEQVDRTIHAVALDGRVDLAEAATRLKWPETRRYPYGSVYDRDGASLFVFDFGAIAQFGSGRLDPAVLTVLEGATGRRALPETAETYAVTVDPEHAHQPRVGWDRVVIPNTSPELVAAVALLLGQSAALERYEKATDLMLEDVLGLTRGLEASGRPPRANRPMLRRIGRLSSDRLEIASLFYLLDRPEETWENQAVAALYDKLFNNLELAQRHGAILHKLQAIETAVSGISNIWVSRLSHRLEWAIVLLIVLEIVLALLGHA